MYVCICDFQDAGSQQIGFLLGSCSVQVALTSEACLKGLPKSAASGEVVAFKGWPKLTWFVTEHLGKSPKDWSPSPRVTDETPAYIEVLESKRSITVNLSPLTKQKKHVLSFYETVSKIIDMWIWICSTPFVSCHAT